MKYSRRRSFPCKIHFIFECIRFESIKRPFMKEVKMLQSRMYLIFGFLFLGVHRFKFSYYEEVGALVDAAAAKESGSRFNIKIVEGLPKKRILTPIHQRLLSQRPPEYLTPYQRLRH